MTVRENALMSHSGRLPLVAGIGLRAPHVAHVLASEPRCGWFEAHSENWFVEGGGAIDALERIRARYPIALHGVGLSLGSTDPLDLAHLAKLQRLIARVDPALVSEHLCWSSVNGRHFNDLLPLPYTQEALDHVCARVGEVQERLGRSIALENVSSYLQFAEADVPEWEFVAAVARRTGCTLLVDVNNIHVNAVNHGFDAQRYLDAIPAACVAEIHLAGHDASGPILIDTHGARVAPAVWALYRRAIERFGPQPTLIEWDTDIPDFAVLEDEARLADEVLEERHALAA
jgi:uncharacterized protein (UPF0276 family)